MLAVADANCTQQNGIDRKVLCDSHLCTVRAYARTIRRPPICVLKNKIAQLANYLQGFAATRFSAKMRRYVY
jgi:hypothetical protein